MEDQARDELEAERYFLLTQALKECIGKGVSNESMKILSIETGFDIKDFIKLMQARPNVIILKI